MKVNLIIALIATAFAQRHVCEQDLDGVITKLNTQNEAIKSLSVTKKKLEELQSKLQNEDVKAILALKTKLNTVRLAKYDMLAELSNLKAANIKGITNVNPTYNSLKLGDRWVIQPETDTALVIRDLKTGGDKRYAFYNDGHSDMYKAGTGGNVVVSRLSFPTRWSISEESGTYLVVRDGVTSGKGKDSRYALRASKYVDL